MQVSNAVVVVHVPSVHVQPSRASQSVLEMSASAHALECVGTQVLPAGAPLIHIGFIRPPPASQIAQSVADEVPAVHDPGICRHSQMTG